MTGRIILIPEAAHSCKGRPDPKPYARGTVWQCDECALKWVVVRGAQYNESYEAWRHLTSANKEGYDR